jgi:hypothetical protein
VRAFRRAAVLVLGALLLVGVATYVAGEIVEVAVLRTTGERGRVVETKLWVADLDGTPWVRVARPGRQWFQRLRAHPEVELARGGETRRYLARPDASEEAKRAVDAAFAAKYGAVDAWYGLLLRNLSVPVRLDPVK